MYSMCYVYTEDPRGLFLNLVQLSVALLWDTARPACIVLHNQHIGPTIFKGAWGAQVGLFDSSILNRNRII